MKSRERIIYVQPTQEENVAKRSTMLQWDSTGHGILLLENELNLLRMRGAKSTHFFCPHRGRTVITGPAKIEHEFLVLLLLLASFSPSFCAMGVGEFWRFQDFFIFFVRMQHNGNFGGGKNGNGLFGGNWRLLSFGQEPLKNQEDQVEFCANTTL